MVEPKARVRSGRSPTFITDVSWLSVMVEIVSHHQLTHRVDTGLMPHLAGLVVRPAEDIFYWLIFGYSTSALLSALRKIQCI